MTGPTPSATASLSPSRSGETSAVPIIIVTGFHAEFDDRLRGIPGVTVLEKPFESTALVDLVELELALAERSG